MAKRFQPPTVLEERVRVKPQVLGSPPPSFTVSNVGSSAWWEQWAFPPPTFCPAGGEIEKRSWFRESDGFDSVQWPAGERHV